MRNLIDELDVLWPQTLRDTLRGKVISDGIERGALCMRIFEHDEGTDALAQSIVGLADSGMIANARTTHEVLVDFVGRDVDAATNEDLLLATIDADAVFIIHVAKVA